MSKRGVMSNESEQVRLRKIASGRRTLLKGALGLSIGLTVVPVAGSQQDPAAGRPREGDLLVRDGDTSRVPLGPADIPLDSGPTVAWAMDPADRTVRLNSRLNRLILMHFDAQHLADDTKAVAADGVVAYTAICTHSGCEVEDWLKEEQLLYCACHSSKFDPRHGARVVEGPAPRSLPALPLRVADGNLVVAKPFSARVGFEIL
jgi:rieske iron-sulfur protein